MYYIYISYYWLLICDCDVGVFWTFLLPLSENKYRLIKKYIYIIYYLYYYIFFIYIQPIHSNRQKNHLARVGRKNFLLKGRDLYGGVAISCDCLGV